MNRSDGSSRTTTVESNDPWEGSVTIDADTATRWILGEITPLAPIRVPLDTSYGLVLAEDAAARDPSPAFDTSAMDGYAVHRHTRRSSAWRVIGRALAGQPFHGEVGRGEAIRIMTGARVPADVDAVVPLEVAVEHDGAVESAAPPVPGAHIRRRGSDHNAGDVVVEQGTRLNAAHLAVLASIGHDRPRVVPRARIGVMSTGDEVTETPGTSGAP